MQDADNLDGVGPRPVEDDVLPFHHAAKVRRKLVADPTLLWMLHESPAPSLDSVQKSQRRGWILGGYVIVDLVQIPSCRRGELERLHRRV